MSREALAIGLDERMERPERIREWAYEFDPSAFEHLRRSAEHVLAAAPGRRGPSRYAGLSQAQVAGRGPRDHDRPRLTRVTRVPYGSRHAERPAGAAHHLARGRFALIVTSVQGQPSQSTPTRAGGGDVPRRDAHAS